VRAAQTQNVSFVRIVEPERRALLEGLVAEVRGRGSVALGDLLRSLKVLEHEDLSADARLGSEPGRVVQQILLDLIAYNVVEMDRSQGE
jgi:hypothetical protein